MHANADFITASSDALRRLTTDKPSLTDSNPLLTIKAIPMHLIIGAVFF